MPTVVSPVDHAQRAIPASEAAMRRLEEALWAAADALPELPDAESLPPSMDHLKGKKARSL